MVDILLTIVISALPLILIGLPYFLLKLILRSRKSKESQLPLQIYKRLYLGFIAFYAFYFIIPSVINILNAPSDQYSTVALYTNDKSNYSTLWQPNVENLLRYIILLTSNALILYLQYPFIILPFIFVVGPIISFAILIYQIRSKDRELKFGEKLQSIQYELETSPRQQITERLSKTDWKNEKELFRALISVLPISLYLLMALLRLLNYEEKQSILQGTSLGWFLEIFFLYLATLIYAVHLLYSAKFAYKGRFIGVALRQQVIQSLSTVGAFISIIALGLFIIEYIEKLWVVLYFIFYFIMAVIFFILIIDLYEPFSVLILTRAIEHFKKAPKIGPADSRPETTKVKLSYTKIIRKGVLLSLIGIIVHGLTMTAVFVMQYFLIRWHGSEKYLSDELKMFYSNFFLIIFILFAGLIIYLSRNVSWSPITNGFYVYLVGIAAVYLWRFYYIDLHDPYALHDSLGIIVSPIFLFLAGTVGVENSWITSVFRDSVFLNIPFIIPELKAVAINFAPILGMLAYPYYWLSYLSQIVLFSMIFFYIGRIFVVNTHRDPKSEHVSKDVFSDQLKIPDVNSIKRNPRKYLLMLNFMKMYPDDSPEVLEEIPAEDRQIQNLLETLDVGKKLVNVMGDDPVSFTDFCTKTNTSLEEVIKFFQDIKHKKLGKLRPFVILRREYGYSYEEVALDSLHVMMVDGRACFLYEFGESSKVEPALVSGLFSAISSFAKEAVKSEEALRSIDHGDTYLTIEYGKYCFAAVFSSGESPAVRKNLQLFLKDFETKHETDLPEWLGDLSIFDQDRGLVEKFFKVETKGKSHDLTDANAAMAEK